MLLALKAGEVVGGFLVGEQRVVVMSRVVRSVVDFVDGVGGSSFSLDSWSY